MSKKKKGASPAKYFIGLIALFLVIAGGLTLVKAGGGSASLAKADASKSLAAIPVSTVPKEISCTDTDKVGTSTLNYYLAGTATHMYSDGTKKIESDSCSTAPNGVGTLFEKYCGTGGTKNSISSLAYKCPGGCYNGACRPTVTVLKPNGGENLTIGSTVLIKWEAYGLPNITIHLRDDSKVDYGYTLLASGDSTNNTYLWEIPSDTEPGSKFKVVVSSPDNEFYDMSNKYFSIDLCSYIKNSTASGSYFSECKNAGYLNACFDKTTLVGQGCVNGTGCTSNNANATRNISCPVK